MDDEEVSEFISISYQIRLIEMAVKENTIIYLPKGARKNSIALIVLKLLSTPLKRTYGQKGKISVILIDSVTLVNQHAKYFEDNTNFKVGRYTGEMNLDSWTRDKWYEEYEKHNILIMTSQILLDLLKKIYINLNKINLLIFDECHRGVSYHPMRQIMFFFQDIQDPPRVLGLTATLLNGNCEPNKVIDQIKCLEATFHAKIATVDGLEDIIGYSTNTEEIIKSFTDHKTSPIEKIAKDLLEGVEATIKAFTPEDHEDSVNKKRLLKLIRELDFDILGVFGGHIATLCYKIEVQRLRDHCNDIKLSQILTYIITMLTYIEKLFENEMKDVMGKERILNYSSDQVKVLILILEKFKGVYGVVFTEKRFTAKIIHHILKKYSEEDPSFGINSNFLLGYQNIPFNSNLESSRTRGLWESLNITEKNKEVIESFVRQEVNLLCSSNILEEGVDIPRCTLVIKFDKPTEYRSYIQSKRRARDRNSFYYIMVNDKEREQYEKKIKGFQQIEEIVNDYLIGKKEQ